METHCKVNIIQISNLALGVHPWQAKVSVLGTKYTERYLVINFSSRHDFMNRTFHQNVVKNGTTKLVVAVFYMLSPRNSRFPLTMLWLAMKLFYKYSS